MYRGGVQELPYFDIERKLPPLLVNLMYEQDISEICVLNGPGSFTTLRLGCLIINTIQQYGDHNFNLFSIHKPALYTQAHDRGLLPKQGFLFIGQKKNMWFAERDTEERIAWRTRIISSENIEDILPETYFIDPCDHMLLEYLDQEYMVDIAFDGIHIGLTFLGNTKKLLLKDIVQEVDILTPEYFIEPKIG